MAISFVDSAVHSVVNTASFDVTLPTTLEDDIVLVCVSGVRLGYQDLGVSTSGYTEVADIYANSTFDTMLSINWKRMGATPDSIVTVNGCYGSAGYGTSVVVYVLRGVDTTTALDVTTTTATGTSGGVPDAPSITPVSSGALVVAVGAGPPNDAAITAPSGYSNSIFKAGTASYGNTCAVASKLWAGGAEDPAVWTDWTVPSASYSWCAATLAFKPGAVDVTIEPSNASVILAGQSPTLGTGINIANSGIVLTGYVPGLEGIVSVGEASIVLTGQALALLDTIPITSNSVTLAGQVPIIAIAKILEPSNANITITGKDVTLSETIPIANGNILVEGYGPLLFVWGSVPEFEIAELVPNPEPGTPHKPCGHWHGGQSDNPVWDFTEQADLPIPYHKHPVKPEVCGHWHKGPIDIVPCIEYVGEIPVSFKPKTHGLYMSNEAMVFHSDGYIYGGAASEGTIFRIEPNDFKIDIQTTFAAANVSGITQLIFNGGFIYAAITRSGYTGQWIQKITIPVDSTESFALVGEPIYCGSVVTGTDGNVYGALLCMNITSLAWRDIWRPITGASWTTGWERLPDDYSYHIYATLEELNSVPASLTTGANIASFLVMSDGDFIINSSPSSGFLASTAIVSLIESDGTFVRQFGTNTIIGPNELIRGPYDHELRLMRCTSALTNLTMRAIDTSGPSSADYLITGLLDPDGGSYDGSIYHFKTVWHVPNNRIYNLHSTWPDDWGRIIAVDPDDGTLLHQYAWEGTGSITAASFVICGDYVYVWQDSLSGGGSKSAIIKLTLDLEFVCIEDCVGALAGGTYREHGEQIITDGSHFIYNFADVDSGEYLTDGVITKWITDPEGYHAEVHDPVWEFTKQSDKF